MGIFKFLNPWAKSVDQWIKKELIKLEKEKTPIRMEIEGHSVHFISVISIRKGMVVVARPLGLPLKKNSVVRFSISPNGRRELIRLQVSVPQFNLFNRSQAFLAQIPTGYAEPSRRSSVRYSTSRFNDLQLVIEEGGLQFSVVDISVAGCRIQRGRNLNWGDLKVGRSMGRGVIRAGKSVEIILDEIVPRSELDQTMGLQFRLADEGSRKLLIHMIKQLDTSHKKAFSAVPIRAIAS